MITLREITEGDTENIIRWRNHPAVRDNFIFREKLTAEAHLCWLNETVRRGKAAQFIIVDGDRDIGSVYLRDIDRAHRKAELGIFIGEADARGRGHGAAAVKLTLRHAFEVLQLDRVYLRVLADNAPAIRSYEKCGFVREGLFRRDAVIGGQGVDVMYMAVLREEIE